MVANGSIASRRGSRFGGVRRRRHELLIGAILISGGGLGAALLADGGSTTSPTTTAPIPLSPDLPQPESGRALTAARLSPGAFPPSLAAGAVVRVLAVGGVDPLDASVRVFPLDVVVEALEPSADGSAESVVTLAGDVSLGDFIAGAGSVRLSIVGTHR